MPDTYLISRLSTCSEKQTELAVTLIHAAAQISSLSRLLLPHSTERGNQATRTCTLGKTGHLDREGVKAPKSHHV